MRSINTRYLGAALVTALVLALGAGTAAANRSLQAAAAEGELGSIRKHATRLTFRDSIESIICEVIRNLRHNRNIAKMIGAQMGVIFDAGTLNCMGVARVTVPGQERFENVRWPKTYDGFTGTLPSITEIRTVVNGVTFLVQGILNGCQYRGNVRFRTGGRAMADLTVVAGSIPFERRLFGEFCGPTLSIIGTLAVTPRVNYTLL